MLPWLFSLSAINTYTITFEFSNKRSNRCRFLQKFLFLEFLARGRRRKIGHNHREVDFLARDSELGTQYPIFTLIAPCGVGNARNEKWHRILPAITLRNLLYNLRMLKRVTCSFVMLSARLSSIKTWVSDSERLLHPDLIMQLWFRPDLNRMTQSS